MLETPVFSTAAVAAPHPRAAAIGQTILASGGNAVEAVVAMAASCAVVLPHLGGLGGDGFFLVREPRGKVHVLDAAGPAGALATQARYRRKEYERVPAHGPDAALTLPGAVAGWDLAVDLAKALGGQLPRDMLLADAILAARDGYAVSHSEERVTMLEDLLAAPGFSGTFLQEGKPLPAGSIRGQPSLADVLERLSHAGFADFYRGDVSREMALDLERLGSPIERRDLETYRARVVQPLSIRLRQAELFAAPAPTDGLSWLLALGIADRLVTGADGRSPHGLIEATKRALSAGARFQTDPREIEGDPADLLDGGFCEREALQIDGKRAGALSPPADAPRGIWLGCIDMNGLAVSYTQSLGGAFGSGCVLPSTGILWNNAGAAFSLDPGSRNPLEPGRRPPRTLSPGLAVLADHRVLVLGGGDPQGLAQVYSAYSTETGLADAIDAARWRLAASDGATVLSVEQRFDSGELRLLRQRGHEVRETEGEYSGEMGHVGMIVKHPRNGRVEAIHDPRVQGSVMGL